MATRLAPLATALALAALAGAGSFSPAIAAAAKEPVKVAQAAAVPDTAAMLDCARTLIGQDYMGRGKVLDIRAIRGDNALLEVVLADGNGKAKSTSVVVPGPELCNLVTARPEGVAAVAAPAAGAGIARRAPRAPREP